MEIWLFVLSFFNVVLVLAACVFAFRFLRHPKDDPRLSRGLQLLQSKISILEDLSDRTEKQVKDLSAVLDRKIAEVHKTLLKANDQIDHVENSMKKSLKVAEIFEDRIPHEQIIERKNAERYRQAAQLLASGRSVQDVAQETKLSIGEVEMIHAMKSPQGLDWIENEANDAFESRPSASLEPQYELHFHNQAQRQSHQEEHRAALEEVRESESRNREKMNQQPERKAHSGIHKYEFPSLFEARRRDRHESEI